MHNERESLVEHPVVITTRLSRSLTDFELRWYSSGSLSQYLLRSIYAEVGLNTVDSWDIQDFVSYGLQRAVQTGTERRSVLVRWIRDEIRRRKIRALNYNLGSTVPEQEFPEPVRSRLPEDVVSWLDIHLPTDLVEALILISEKDLTWEEVTEKLSLDISKVSRQLIQIRRKIIEENREKEQYDS